MTVTPIDDPARSLAPHAVLDMTQARDVADGCVARSLATAMFLDVGGFTGLSERLGALGSAGTEELVGILNGFFGSSIDLVHGSGGEVAAFGGDAITAVWPGEGSGAAASTCATQLVELARSIGLLATAVGAFELTVKIGAASGAVDVAVGDSGGRSLMLTQGAAIDAAVAAEQLADPNGIVWGDRSQLDALEADPGEVAGRPATMADPARFAHPVIVDRVRRGDTTLIDGHRRVTSLFASLPPMTGGAAHLEALPGWICRVLGIVNGAGGEVIQITGSDKGTAALVTFGAPTSSPDDAIQAVGVGMRLAAEIDGCAVGLGTGSVFAGLVGGSGRREYTVIGDAVNRAARLMQIAESGAVAVDEPTATAAEAAFRFDRWGTVRPKGLREGVRIAHLAEQRRRVWSPNPLATDGPMLGRTEELAVAERALERRAGGVRRVVLRGAAGIGKSRLVRAIADRAAARGWQVHAGGFAAFDEVTPYVGWRPIVRGILDDADGGAEGFDRLLPGSRELAPILMPMLGRELPETRRSSSLEGELRNELAEELIAGAIEAAAHERPVLIVLEDWHWADASSSRLLDVITSRSSSAPVTILITQRLPLAGTALETRTTDTVIELSELGDAVARDVASSAMARTGRTADPGWVDRIVELGGGNPLMVETLIEVGDESALTTGLAPLLQARLDGLPDDELAPILWASAFGRPVAVDELEAAMVEGDAAVGAGDLSDRLDRLVASGLLVTVPTADADPLGFRHASVREAAYGRLSHSSRREVHHAVGLTLERRHGRAPEIAHHLAQTDDLDRQLRWFPAAGFEARAAWAVDDAIGWFDRARAIGERSDEVRIVLAEMLMVRGEHDRVGEIVTGPCATSDFDRRRLMIVGERAMVTGASDEAIDTLAEALRLAERSGSPAETAAASELLSRALIATGRLEEADEVTQRTIEGLDPTDHDTLARAIGALGVVQIYRQDLPGAIATLRRAIVEAEQGRDRVRLVHLRSDLAATYAMAGDVRAALDEMGSAREVAATIGYRRHLALSAGNEAELRIHVGDGAGSATLALEGLRAATALGDIGLACDNLLRLAANPSLPVSDRRSIFAPTLGLETALRRPYEGLELQVVGVELAAEERAASVRSAAETTLAMARSLARPDLEVRTLVALGDLADEHAVAELRARIEDPGDRFLLDVTARRVNGDRHRDDGLRARGLELYRSTPFVTYRAALATLGVTDPPTDVIVPPYETTSDDSAYSLGAVLDLVGDLERLARAGGG